MYFAYQVSKILSIAAFLFYGLSCLLSDGMVAEFERYGLSRFRRLTGGLEVLGALGLAAGYFVAPVDAAAALGLVVLMILGIIVRVRVRDPLLAMSPAIFLMLLNLYIFFYAVRLARPA